MDKKISWRNLISYGMKRCWGNGDTIAYASSASSRSSFRKLAITRVRYQVERTHRHQKHNSRESEMKTEGWRNRDFIRERRKAHKGKRLLVSHATDRYAWPPQPILGPMLVILRRICVLFVLCGHIRQATWACKAIQDLRDPLSLLAISYIMPYLQLSSPLFIR